MDVVAIMEALAEQGVTVLFKADAERMAEGRGPWTFVASGAPLREDVFVRTDAASVEQCLAACLPRLREVGLSFPGCESVVAVDHVGRQARVPNTTPSSAELEKPRITEGDG
ncbi:hypothetical protein QEZ40_005795 [Streptomyces katrae]|uniref:Uncharacterized protein n=1 Tax=Streptomyces katrae TaxID=68223 RepID=A0ABT7H2P5_9ACTN|nr:hypothetical protein [Streptomyces katrae]MDK9500168.1 hypothetical protein [Streptomyces katrae]